MNPTPSRRPSSLVLVPAAFALVLASAPGTDARAQSIPPDGDGAGLSGSGQSANESGDTGDTGDSDGSKASGRAGANERGPYTLFNPAPLDGTISTGRPAFSTGTTAVPAGHLQLESGYLFSEDSADSSQQFPNFLLRLGLTDTVEARVQTTGYVQNDTGEDGLTGVRLGAKIEVLHQDTDGISLAVQPSLRLPGDVPGGDNVDPLVQVAAAYSVSDRVGLLANLNAGGVTKANGDQQAAFSHSVLASYSPADRISFYVEQYGQYGDEGRPRQSADAGVLYLLDDNNQIDLVVGVGLNGPATDYFVGAGYSFRF